MTRPVGRPAGGAPVPQPTTVPVAWDARGSNVADLVARAAVSAPDRVALVEVGAVAGDEAATVTERTWAELDAAVSGLAAALAGRGLARGARVALLLGNTVDFAVAWFGVLRAGLVAVPMNTGYTAAEIGHQLRDSGADLLLVPPGAAGPDPAQPAPDPGGVAAVQAATDERVPVATVADLLSPASPASPAAGRTGQPDAPAAAAGGEDLAALVYTSGTSGLPRGAMLTHRALLANQAQVAQISPPPVGPGDTVLLVLPLFHIYGLNAGLTTVAWHAATGVLVPRFDPVGTLALLADRGVSTIVGAPPMYVAWSMLPSAAEAFSSVRLAISGAAPLPPEVLTRVLDATGQHIFEGYGLTETAPVLTTTLCSPAAKPGSIGRPVPGVALRLVGADGTEVDDDDPGEIVVAGPNLFSGYWPDGAGGPDAAGWWPTGDVAYADADGDLHLVDRRRDLILVSGFNVYPREVEDVLAAHPSVGEVAVIGMPHPYTGESVLALVVPAAGQTAQPDELMAFAARRLARFKCPTAVRLVDALPRSATGKVRRAALRTSLGAAAADPDPVAADAPSA